MTLSSENQKIDHILNTLDKLESRISAIENKLKVAPHEITLHEEDDLALSMPSDKTSDEMELQIGEFWFAKVDFQLLELLSCFAACSFLLLSLFAAKQVCLPSPATLALSQKFACAPFLSRITFRMVYLQFSLIFASSSS